MVAYLYLANGVFMKNIKKSVLRSRQQSIWHAMSSKRRTDDCFKVCKINSEDINVSFTANKGYIECDYYHLKDLFGLPNRIEDSGSKTDAEWTLEFTDGSVATIYNWKDGKNYCGESGLDICDIKEWNIGGHSSKVFHFIKELVYTKKWEAFENIRISMYFTEELL